MRSSGWHNNKVSTSLNMVHTQRYFLNRYRFILVPLVAGLLLCNGCQAGKQQASATGYLRGNTILSLRLPVHGTRRDVIEVNAERRAGRAFTPSLSPVAVNYATIPDGMWDNLEALRRAWCDHPPAFATGPLTEDKYSVVFQCGRFADPVFAVPPDRLPPALRELVQLVPPAP